MSTGVRIHVRGIVQGVGFRPWVYRLATDTGITGRVHNGSAGVTIEAFGPAAAVDSFVRRLRREPPTSARIDGLETSELSADAPAEFRIEASDDVGTRQLTIGPDLATCPACMAEVRDAHDRRHRYAFTNCTQCGPRLTIIDEVPYDRSATTMAVFEMCADCAAEYETVSDRRFHAEPNACPRCGPRLGWRDASGVIDVGDAMRAACDAILAGRVVLVKGLGGYHLVCDATSDDAVQRLRDRKARDEKPFAVMVADVEAAEAFALMEPSERVLLESVERPIVLLRRGSGRLADAVARDCARVGIMLPYTPLHHLLLDATQRPLVMTSANLAHEPTVFRDDEARQLLGPVADYALDHDRRIVLRVDDSVAAVIAGAPLILRRSRGYAPRPIRLAEPVAEPILACGAQLKNTFCIAVDDLAYLGPHIGDLDSVASLDSFRDSIRRFEAMLDVEPVLIAHDLHPDMPSTRYALARTGRHVAVQHHHAHVASAMAEHGLHGPVVGVAYDGTGLGTDGTSWGGEILVADRASFARVATLRPIALAGGDRAIMQPWRIALALLDDAFDGRPPLDRLDLFRQIPSGRIEQLRQIMGHRAHAPLSHGAGRYFDAIGALLLNRPRASYEAQLAMALEQAADPLETGSYEFVIDEDGETRQLDFRPMVRRIVADHLDGAPLAATAARFHHTIAAATAKAVHTVAPDRPIVLTGGCFQNALLTAGLTRLLSPRQVLLQRQAPPNDGGIALGQVWVAAATPKTSEGRQ
jgi:hydrogenase maturation protein HypF